MGMKVENGHPCSNQECRKWNIMCKFVCYPYAKTPYSVYWCVRLCETVTSFQKHYSICIYRAAALSLPGAWPSRKEVGCLQHCCPTWYDLVINRQQLLLHVCFCSVSNMQWKEPRRRKRAREVTERGFEVKHTESWNVIDWERLSFWRSLCEEQRR